MVWLYVPMSYEMETGRKETNTYSKLMDRSRLIISLVQVAA